MPGPTLSRSEVYAVAALVGCDHKTVEGFLQGRRVMPAHERLIRAAIDRVVAGRAPVGTTRGDFAGPGLAREA